MKRRKGCERPGTWKSTRWRVEKTLVAWDKRLIVDGQAY